VTKHFEFLAQINEGDSQNFVYEIIVPIQLLKGSVEHFQLEIKVHAYWTIESYQPGMDCHVRILPFGTGCTAWTTKINAVFGPERPITIDDDIFQFPILPSTLSDPGNMKSVCVTSS
jgi:hypothetical protein